MNNFSVFAVRSLDYNSDNISMDSPTTEEAAAPPIPQAALNDGLLSKVTIQAAVTILFVYLITPTKALLKSNIFWW